MMRALSLSVLCFSLCACSSTPSPALPDPSSGEAAGPEAISPTDQYALDEPFRESAGLLQGDITLNGTTETDPNWDPSPLPISQQVQQGTMALFRVKGKLSDSSATTLYTKLSQPGKNYPSYAIPGTNVDQYKALYIEQPDIMTWTFYNSTSFNTPVNAKSASFNYFFKTQALENADEPNDDDNGATITDRTLAKSIGIGATSTRSVFQVDNSPLKDVEEWYKISLSANQRIQWRFATTPGQYSSWSFVMKMYTNGGNQVGPTVNVASTAAAAILEHKVGSAGTYFLQIVGTPISKSYTNMFFKLYTITPCIPPEVTSLNFTPQTELCPGSQLSLSASVINGATGYSWNFGGGATPNTSTSPNPTVTAGSAGEYSLSLTVSNGCGSKTYTYGYQVGCAGVAKQMGGSTSLVVPVDLSVEANGRTHLLLYFQGSPDLNPGAGELVVHSAADGMALLVLDAQGDLVDMQTWIPVMLGPEGMYPAHMAYDPAHGYIITGQYTGQIDFNPGTGNAIRNASTDGGFFYLALDSSRNFKWVVTNATVSAPSRPHFRSGTSQVFLPGNYQGTVDFDPGMATVLRTSNGGRDCYCLLLDGYGGFVSVVTWGGEGADFVSEAGMIGNALHLTGQFQSTVDFDPGPGTASATSLGDSSIYAMCLTPDATFAYQRHAILNGLGGGDALAGLVLASGGGLRFGGNFFGTIDFDPGVATANRTSAGQSDAYLVSLNPSYGFNWVYTLGGTSPDSAIGIAIVPGTDALRLSGMFAGTVDFDPTGAVDNRDGTDGNYVVGIGNNGSRLFAATWDGIGDIMYPSAIGVDAVGLSRTAGYFNGTVDFDPGVSVAQLTSSGVYDGYLQRLTATGTW